MHILGYSKEFDKTKLPEGLKATHRGYEIRGHKIIDNLNYENPDFNLDYNRMREFYKASYIGRNQIALELTKQSKKISLDDALKATFIRENNEWMLTPAKAIKLINDSGGKAFLAHPKNLMSKLPNILSSLKTAGLSGVEAITAKISLAESTNIIKMAKKLSLAISAGSDWHGPTLTPNAKVGFDIEKNDLNWLTKPQ